jgi:hypothetical protein
MSEERLNELEKTHYQRELTEEEVSELNTLRNRHVPHRGPVTELEKMRRRSDRLLSARIKSMQPPQ